MDNLYVYRSGHVERGPVLPDGAISLMQSDNPEDFEDHLVACRLMHDGSHVIGTVFDAYRAEQATTDEDRFHATVTSVHPEDTPEQALERWLIWRGVDIKPPSNQVQK